jgi:hypothetical protein
MAVMHAPLPARLVDASVAAGFLHALHRPCGIVGRNEPALVRVSAFMQTPDLDDQLDRLERICPAYLAKPIHFLRQPRLRWLRLTAGVLLIIGGLFWFMPILGLEMIPIGLMLIALDVPFLRGPVARMIAWGERKVLSMIVLWETIRAHLRTPKGRDANSRS